MICSRATAGYGTLLARVLTFMCLLIGQSNEVLQHESVKADSAAGALERMGQALRHRPGVISIEIWQEGQLSLRMTLNELATKPWILKR